MADIVVEQALFRRPDGAAPALLARSAGFADEWQAEAERLMVAFGERPPGVRCAAAVFAQPFGKDRVAIVQVADQGDATQPPHALGFQFLVLTRRDYTQFLGDPFAVAERFPASWLARGELPALTMSAEPLPPRTVAEVQTVLKRVKHAALAEEADPRELLENEPDADVVANSEGPALLGGTQVLVDGGKLVFVRPAPDTGLLRGLWTLLPTSTRNELWPASFAFSNQLGFDALIVPGADGKSYVGYTNEEQAAEYPTGRYELRLQTAAEAGDQDELDALFGRRSLKEIWRLGLILLGILAAGVLFLKLTAPPEVKVEPPPRRPVLTQEQRRELAGIAAASLSVGDPWTALGLIRVGNDVRQRMERPK